MVLRLATWNTKQGVAPRKKTPQLWEWLHSRVDPDVAVLTEAKIPKGFSPTGWQTVYRPGGIGPRRQWGTIHASRGPQLVEVSSVQVGGRAVALEFEWPAAVVVTDVIRDRQRWATLVGIYGITLNRHGESCGHGRYSVPLLLKQLAPLFESDRADRIIVAGDFNMWPCDVPREFNTLGLVDLIADTAHTRPALANCSGCDLGHGCGHLWTHRNGTSPNAAVQQIDYIFATAELRSEVSRVFGGVGDFPEAWDVSDHAPVVAEFF